jgi:toxin ParE1/3/4
VKAGATIWAVRVTNTARDDFRRIIGWSVLQFGKRQARIDADTLSAAIQELMAGPTLCGVQARDDIAAGILTLHVARNGRTGRHFVMFQVAQQHRHVIDVLRILHEAMDLPRHMSSFMRDA